MPFRNDSDGRDRRAALTAFQRSVKFKFKNITLLDRALTHRSYVNEDPSCIGNNERLEFLGDAVLGMVCAFSLFKALGDRPEGDLARIKSHVVSEDTLSEIAINLQINELIKLGKGEERSGGRSKKAILADAMEAIFGAAFLDSGFDKAGTLVLSLIKPEIEKVLLDKHRKDYKTLLQEYSQKYLHCYPTYTLSQKSGPDHDRTYWISCSLKDQNYGPAEGKTKKEAEQAAAALAYRSIVEGGGQDAKRILSIGKL